MRCSEGRGHSLGVQCLQGSEALQRPGARGEGFGSLRRDGARVDRIRYPVEEGLEPAMRFVGGDLQPERTLQVGRFPGAHECLPGEQHQQRRERRHELQGNHPVEGASAECGRC